jgi:hypothetical protein
MTEQDDSPTVQEWIRDAFSSVTDFFGSFSVLDWVLVGVALLALVWVVASVYAMTHLGPVEVEAFEHDDGDDGPGVKALTSAMRERLARNGLVPAPEVPAGTPQVDLVAAVEASPAPQSAFLAKLIELAPKPPQAPRYKVSGVVLGKEPSGDEQGTTPCGLSYWVKPSREGGVLIGTVTDHSKHSGAIQEAASKIYLHISNASPHAVPLWARWRKEASLERYLDSCWLVRSGLHAQAIPALEATVAAEPFNALAQLKLANVYEVCVPDDQSYHRAMCQAVALRRYLDIARDWPTLVEAHYRAGIVAGALATTASVSGDMALSPTQLQRIRQRLRLPDVTASDFVPRLEGVAARESKAALQLLRAWFPLVREQRLRTLYEPKGHERRGLKHTVVISRRCVRMRKLCGYPKQPEGSYSRLGLGEWIRVLRRRAEIRLRTVAVLFRHRVYGRGARSWQMHYNAACFDALLLAYLKRPPESGAHRTRRVRQRSLAALDLAIKDARDRLSASWMERDPDMQVFRQGDAEWERLVHRVPRRSPTVLALPALTDDEKHDRPTPYPGPPWGDPTTRARWWLAILVLAMVLAVGLFVWQMDDVWWLIPLPIAVLSAWRLRHVFWERRGTLGGNWRDALRGKP